MYGIDTHGAVGWQLQKKSESSTALPNTTATGLSAVSDRKIAVGVVPVERGAKARFSKFFEDVRKAFSALNEDAGYLKSPQQVGGKSATKSKEEPKKLLTVGALIAEFNSKKYAFALPVDKFPRYTVRSDTQEKINALNEAIKSYKQPIDPKIKPDETKAGVIIKKRIRELDKLLERDIKAAQKSNSDCVGVLEALRRALRDVNGLRICTGQLLEVEELTTGFNNKKYVLALPTSEQLQLITQGKVGVPGYTISENTEKKLIALMNK